jgi:glyoxylase-like metal-dependent hydrolase (beta-lactamase superfamily II)
VSNSTCFIMTLYAINTGYFKLDGGAMFGVVPKSIWNKINPADENNMCRWALRCLLIEDNNKLILIDTGMGDKQDAKFFGHYYMHGDDTLDKSLGRHGFERNDITDVILTHLHFDHCGGSIIRENDKLIPAFKNAVYWSNKIHWDWAINPNERERASFLKENILPIAESGQLKLIDSKQLAVESVASTNKKVNLLEIAIPELPAVQLRIVNGHTQCMMLPQIKYKGKTIVYLADLLPSQGHIPIPYIMAYDMFPLTSLNEKKSFLQEALENDYILFFEHDPIYECCNLTQTERGIRPKDFFKLDEV